MSETTIGDAEAVEYVIKDSLGLTAEKLSQKDFDQVTKLEITTWKVNDLLAANESFSGLLSAQAVSFCRNLEFLDVNNNKISEISSLSYLTKLKHLNLSCNALDDSQMRYLLELKELEYLSLGMNSSITHLPDLSRFTKLKVLEICGLDELENFEVVSACEDLETIDVRSLRIKDLSPLDHLKNLSFVYWGDEGNRIPVEEIDRLRKLLGERDQYCEFTDGMESKHSSDFMSE